jgi:hypothetical protein
MPEPLASALPIPDRGDNTPANAGVVETPPASGIPTPQTPAPAPVVPAAGAVSTETQQILDSLKAVQEQVTGLSERVDEFPPVAPEIPLEVETKPKWQPNSWDEFPDLVDKRAKEIVEETLAAKEQAIVDEKASVAAGQQEIDKDIDAKVAVLETQGRIPPVKDANNPDDVGRVFRRELYGLAAKMETLNLEEVTNQLSTMHQQGLHYDFKANKWLRVSAVNPGQNVPVGSSSSAGAGSPDSPSYETIHKARSLSELARRAGM